MASELGQDERIAKVKTKFGDDKLFLTRFTGSEGMSHLFEFRVEGVSEEKELDFDKQLGQDATVTIKTKGQGDRFFTGTCVELQRLGRDDDVYRYLLVLRPKLWLLSKRVNSRIFHNQPATDILNTILSEHGITPETSFQESHPDLEYCVQHRESDLAFVLRLMEAEGIGYHFKFGESAQTLVLADSQSAYQSITGATRDYIDVEDYRADDKEHIYRWSPERRFTTQKAVLSDYKFQEPDNDLLGEKAADDVKFDPKLEDYRHPYHQHLGENTTQSDGENYAKTRILSERSTDGRFLSSGDAASLTPGYKVTLKGHETDDGDYLIVGCAHTIEHQPYRSGQAGGTPYTGQYELMKFGRFVPPIVTPKPVVGGLQTGVVVGESDKGTKNEIHTDQFGRIKVHMHWTRESPDEEEGRSMWCRLSQVWAGGTQKWGAIFIPRVGMEVLVNFLDGDPDRPIVVGTVYNMTNPVPYDLPGREFEAGWKSNWQKDNGKYHELVFNDTENEEMIRVYTDRNLETEVKEYEKRTVHIDRDVEIKHDDNKQVGNEHYVEAQKKITLKVGRSTIVMEPDKITIKSTEVLVEAKVDLTTKSGGTASHTSVGPMTIQGAVVNIN